MPIKLGTYKKIPIGAKTIGCKWVYKTKCDSKGNIERFKAQLVVKGFTQGEGIELHQMDVKTAFQNGDLYKNFYMAQVMEGKENLGCRLKKSIYGLKQVSR